MGADKLFNKKKERDAKDLARRAAKKSPYESALIVCEGEKTEVNYLKELIRHHRLNTANIEVLPSAKGSAPISIIEFAIELAESREGIDQVFCVFDRDDHESYLTAVNKIKHHKSDRKAKSKPKHHAITSTPCFEIWPLLHFTYTTKAYTASGNRSACDSLVTDLRQHINDYAKNILGLFERINQRQGFAIKNAEKLKNDNINTGSKNPDTDVHELIEYLITLTKK